MTKEILLTKNKVVLVDDEDFAWLCKRKWQYGCGKYAFRGKYLGSVNGKEKRKMILMHREIMQTPDGMDTDHINGNTLDNRRCNLRICTRSQNNANQKSLRGTTSKYKGVCWDTAERKWKAYIGKDGKLRNIGRYNLEIEAAKAYNTAAIKFYGEFAKINSL